MAGLAVALALAFALLAPASAAVPVQVLAHGESSRGLARLEVALTAGAEVPTGLGLAVAFDSVALELLGIEEFFAAGLLGAPPSPEPDATDLDGDPRTDTVMRFAWLSAARRWEADGILIMRHLFGFSGATLVKDALGSGATRTTGEAVSSLLNDAACLGMLDVDGSGHGDALTDGVLAARYLFGFTGASLVSGALGAGATRTSGEVIAGHLDTSRGSGPILVLRAPVVAAPLLSQIEASLLVGTTYTGDGRLTYTLAQGPAGMTLDPQLGWLSWMPPASRDSRPPSR